ncbi:hypothetical protein AB0I60_18915 [Actinosynnema sp. NPDC050436]|uniref:hypothetical protein n=1 Tax=Actinosynnema sp. NPDC050436 TaxID=3155659 RepID=UPI0033D5D992
MAGDAVGWSASGVIVFCTGGWPAGVLGVGVGRGDGFGVGQSGVVSGGGAVIQAGRDVTIHPPGRGAAGWWRGSPDPGAVADRLAAAVWAQWSAAASDRGLLQPAALPLRWRRSTAPVAGPVSAATSPRPGALAFAPLPGLAPITPDRLRDRTHHTLYQVYGGLPSGRVIVTGGPGTGKSSAAILLLLDALRHRHHLPPEARALVPVPVLFTLHGWNPDTTPVADWLVGRLSELGPLAGRRGRRHAAQLLATGGIAVFLDGLDEIPDHHRPTALRALADQATFRLVLLTRTRELAAAAEHHILTGAIALELQPQTPSDAAAYLRDGLPDPPPPAWRNLLHALDNPARHPTIARALDNPLTITLLRDTHHPPPPPDSPVAPLDHLLNTAWFPTPDHITHHLLDHAITTAYTPRPGRPPPRYTPRTAHRTLTVIARHLRDTGTRDLRWWHIPTWPPRTHRILLTLLSYWLVLAPLSTLPTLLEQWHGSRYEPSFFSIFSTSFGMLFCLASVGGRPRFGKDARGRALAGMLAGCLAGIITFASFSVFGWLARIDVISLTSIDLVLTTMLVLVFTAGRTATNFSTHEKRRGDLSYRATFGLLAVFAFTTLISLVDTGVISQDGVLAITAVTAGQGLMFGMVFSLANTGAPCRIGRHGQSRFGRSRSRTLAIILSLGLGAGAPLGISTKLLADGAAIESGIVQVVLMAVICVLAVGCGFALADRFNVGTTALTTTPRGQRRDDLAYWFVFGGTAGLVYAFFFPAMTVVLGYPPAFPTRDLVLGAITGLALGLVSSSAWWTAVGQVYLTLRYRIPLRLGRFLDDAHHRHLLRTVGPVYQFRHATLQDRLAPVPRPQTPPTAASQQNPRGGPPSVAW